MKTGWLQIIACILQLVTGFVIVAVELVIIKRESPGTPGAFSLLHEEVAVKGLCQFLGGLVSAVAICRKTHMSAILSLIASSMNCLTLVFLMWQCAYGISQVKLQCSHYPESCVAESAAMSTLTLLQTQESMFTIGTVSCIVATVILSRSLQKVIRVEQNSRKLIQRGNERDNLQADYVPIPKQNDNSF